jgi:hypothetical protein
LPPLERLLRTCDRGSKGAPPNQASKLTRRAACVHGGPAFGEDHGVRRPCTSRAVQLNAGVGQTEPNVARRSLAGGGTVYDECRATSRRYFMTLRKRRLGSQGLEVGAIGLGCMGMSQSYGPADEAESISTLHRAIELGCDFFDTAENYGPFTNEALLGRAFKDRRGKVVIATKFGSRFEGDKIVGMDSRPENIVRVVEGCLRRLQTDHIDLLYQHRLDRTVPIKGARYASS